MIRKKLIGAHLIVRGVFDGIIKDDPKSIKLYKKLGLPVFEETKPLDKDATKKKSTKQ